MFQIDKLTCCARHFLGQSVWAPTFSHLGISEYHVNRSNLKQAGSESWTFSVRVSLTIWQRLCYLQITWLIPEGIQDCLHQQCRLANLFSLKISQAARFAPGQVVLRHRRETFGGGGAETSTLDKRVAGNFIWKFTDSGLIILKMV